MSFVKVATFKALLREYFYLSCLGAGLLALVISLFFFDQWHGLDRSIQKRWFPASLKSPICREGILVIGNRAYSPLLQRRKDLVGEIDFLQTVRPKLIVLEDWLDESSQSDTQELLESLRQDWQAVSEKLPSKHRKVGQTFQNMLDEAQSQIRTDHTLAVDFAEENNFLLPMAAVIGKNSGPPSKGAF